MLGEADGAGSGAVWNKRVELRELVAYLEQAVGGWVTQRRSARQTPVMLGSGGEQPNDFALAYCRHVADVPPEIAVEGPQDSDLWEAHDQFAPWKDTPPRLPPHAWLPYAALQRGLTRLEELRLAGKAYEGQADALRKELRRLVDDLNKPLAAPRAQVSLHEFPTDPSRTELLVNDVRAGTASTDAAKKREWEQSYRSRSYHDRAAGVWRHLVADGVAPGASVLASLDLVGAAAGSGIPRAAPLRQWRENGHLTAAYPDRPADRAGLVHRAIIVRDKAQQLVNREDSRAFVLMEPILEEADRLRRRADDGLFHAATTPDDYRQAEATYDRAIQLQERVLDRAPRGRSRVPGTSLVRALPPATG